MLKPLNVHLQDIYGTKWLNISGSSNSMRIIENREIIDFTALYAGKVSLETYFRCEDQLKEAATGCDYICPPQHRTKAKRDYWAKRVEEIYRSH